MKGKRLLYKCCKAAKFIKMQENYYIILLKIKYKKYNKVEKVQKLP